jgi:hypothetical protein
MIDKFYPALQSFLVTGSRRPLPPFVGRPVFLRPAAGLMRDGHFDHPLGQRRFEIRSVEIHYEHSKASTRAIIADMNAEQKPDICMYTTGLSSRNFSVLPRGMAKSVHHATNQKHPKPDKAPARCRGLVVPDGRYPSG